MSFNIFEKLNKKLIVILATVGFLILSVLASVSIFDFFKSKEKDTKKAIVSEKKGVEPEFTYKYAEPGKIYDYLYLIKIDGLYGYINNLGEIVIKPKYKIAGHFSDGLAPTCLNYSKCGYINAQDEFVINPQFSSVGPFSEGLAAVKNEEGLVGYIDKTGKYVIQPNQDFLVNRPVKDGTVVKQTFENKYAPCTYLDKNNKIIIKLEKGGVKEVFTNVDYTCKLFSDGLLLVGYRDKKGDFKYAYINKKGEIELEFFVRDLACTPGNFSNGLIRIKSRKDKKWSYVDKKGNMVISPQFTLAADFSDGYAAVSLDEALSNRKGELGYVKGKNSEQCKLGYINKKGEFVSETKFCMTWPFKKGLAYVGTEDKFGYINTKGEFVWNSGSRIPWFIFR